MTKNNEWTGFCIDVDGKGVKLREFIEESLKEIKLPKAKQEELSTKIMEGVLRILGWGSILKER
ncbi:MAG: hypothetical protein M0P69_05415 [Bacteroidales bacterium]|jgi:hypothetical protein|nr:hypothetical protein [Bacteroidales bacterium]